MAHRSKPWSGLALLLLVAGVACSERASSAMDTKASAQRNCDPEIGCDPLPLPDPPPAPPPPPPNYDVGVLAGSTGCPAGAEVVIHMDDEDKGWSHQWGWVGRSDSSYNTEFHFCRVAGQQFKPLGAVSDAGLNYAVLRLGSACPPGSQQFSRYFDNQDTELTTPTDNWVSGNIGPNIVTANTSLFFCLFRGGPTVMSAFPVLGMPYGVFAAPELALALDVGTLRVDDENSNNVNSYAVAASAYLDATRIIGDGPDTVIHVARVR